jgi:hypothetical protein
MTDERFPKVTMNWVPLEVRRTGRRIRYEEAETAIRLDICRVDIGPIGMNGVWAPDGGLSRCEPDIYELCTSKGKGLRGSKIRLDKRLSGQRRCAGVTNSKHYPLSICNFQYMV